MDDIKSRLRNANLRYANETVEAQKVRRNTTIFEAAAYIERLEAGLLKIATYPLDSGRCTDDGYPSEVVYDEYAYKRMVDSYRKAASATLKGGEND